MEERLLLDQWLESQLASAVQHHVLEFSSHLTQIDGTPDLDLAAYVKQ